MAVNERMQSFVDRFLEQTLIDIEHLVFQIIPIPAVKRLTDPVGLFSQQQITPDRAIVNLRPSCPYGAVPYGIRLQKSFSRHDGYAVKAAEAVQFNRVGSLYQSFEKIDQDGVFLYTRMQIFHLQIIEKSNLSYQLFFFFLNFRVIEESSFLASFTTYLASGVLKDTKTIAKGAVIPQMTACTITEIHPNPVRKLVHIR